MEKIVKIDIINEIDLIAKYNRNKVNPELLNYILKQIQYISNKDDIKLVVNNHSKAKIDIENLMRNSFADEFLNTFKDYYKNELIQIFLFFLGVVFLIISAKIKKTIWHEIFLIGGWVPIWKMVELEMSKNFPEHRKRKLLNKLKTAKIEIINN